MLPVPASTTGEITQDDEKGFQAYVSNTPIDEFKNYVAACADRGFNIDAYESDESYSAENSEGYKLSVSYQGNSVISISVDEPEYEVSIEIECVENWAFSKYDVDVYIDDSFEGTIDHGTTETFAVTMSKGTYEIRFVNAEDDEVTGTVVIDIHQDESLRYKISCTSTKIDVETIVGTIAEYGEDEAPMPQSASSYKFGNYEDVQKELTDAGFTNISFEILYDIVLGWTNEGEIENISVDGKTDFDQGDIFKKDAPIVITYHMKEEDDPNKPVESETPDVEEDSPVFYSTNTYEVAKEGNSGVFSYRDRGNSYDIYWIIDFDEGYVYYFTDGNGDSTCDRLKIDSGTLNDKVIITYHDGGDEWSYSLHFKYVDHPETLIMVDQNGFDYKYSTTDLDDALSLRATKTIKDY